MKVLSKDREGKSKTVNSKTLNGSIHHISWTMHKPEECKLGMAQSQQCSSSHTTASQRQFLQAYLALIQQVTNLTCSSFKSRWSHQEWWFGLIWQHRLHGFCALAKASNTNPIILALYILFIPIMLQHLFSSVQPTYHDREKYPHHQSIHLLAQGVPPKAPIKVPSV